MEKIFFILGRYQTETMSKQIITEINILPMDWIKFISLRFFKEINKHKKAGGNIYIICNHLISNPNPTEIPNKMLNFRLIKLSQRNNKYRLNATDEAIGMVTKFVLENPYTAG